MKNEIRRIWQQNSFQIISYAITSLSSIIVTCIVAYVSLSVWQAEISRRVEASEQKQEQQSVTLQRISSGMQEIGEVKTAIQAVQRNITIIMDDVKTLNSALIRHIDK